MSKISQIHDAIYARVISLLPNHKELTNPRFMEQNDALYLRKGFAINITSGENTNRDFACSLSYRRTLLLTNTLQVFGTDRDTTLRKTTEKNLLEDQFLLIKDIEKDPTLNQVTNQINFLSDNGIQEVFFEQGSFLMIQSQINFEYFEDL